MGQLTSLLSEIGAGRADALAQLYEMLYPELHRLARSRMRRTGELTLLDTTSLVHESYIRFERLGSVRIADRNQFMSYAARVMRSVAVDVVRARLAEQRGGGVAHVELDHADEVAAGPAGKDDVLRVHEAIEELAAIDDRLARVVEMRYLAGMTETEIAAALGVSQRTVTRDWEKARLFLRASLR